MKNIIHKTLIAWFVALAVVLASPIAQSFTIDASSTSTSPMTGLWNNDNEPGWGVTVIQQYGMMFVTMYAYDGSGNPIWYVASACPVSGNGCTGPLYKVTGGSPLTAPWNGTNKIVTPVGTLSLAFSDLNTGTMTFTINGITGSKGFKRDVFALAPPTINFAGTYAGTYSGLDIGIFSVTIYNNGYILGEAYSTVYSQTLPVSGTVSTNGTLSMSSSGTTGAATFTGTINATGVMTGTWAYVGLNAGGTFNGHK